MAETTWLDGLLDEVLSKQDAVSADLPAELKFQGRNRKARLIITGEPSTVRYFRWTGRELVDDGSPVGCRNTIEMHVDTLLDLATGLQRPREAVAAGLVQVTGDLPQAAGKAFYDAEEFLQLLDRMATRLTRLLQVRL